MDALQCGPDASGGIDRSHHASLCYIRQMKAHHTLSQAPLEEVDLFEMANLYPKHTGLPMTVWISSRGHARHDARVKVCRAHGNRMDVDDTAVVGIRPEPTLIEGPLPAADLKAVQGWITLNRVALIDYWDGKLDTVDLVQSLKRL